MTSVAIEYDYDVSVRMPLSLSSRMFEWINVRKNFDEIDLNIFKWSKINIRKFSFRVLPL